MTPQDRNLRTMLGQFEKFLGRAGYVKGSRKKKAQLNHIAALLVDARLYCKLRGIDWKKAVELAKGDLLHDLDELRWMDDEHLNLRRINHLRWPAQIIKGMRI